MNRKTIALMTAHPECLHVQRILRGIQEQCRKYNYHLTVFSPMIFVNTPLLAYLSGEINIYNLVNYDLVDGVIVDTAMLQGDTGNSNIRSICERMRRECKKPVAALDLPAADYHVIENNNEAVLRDMCRHAIEVHKKKKLCILTGQKGYEIAESRLAVMLDEIRAHGLEVRKEHIVYGDFWYSGGDALANQFLSGTVPIPEAVLCASDHMALGLIDRLTKHGIRIPEDLLVLGFEATEEAATNPLSLSSFEANDAQTAANAVDWLRQQIEPNAPLDPYIPAEDSLFHPGMSCGCEPDYLRSARTMQSTMYHASRNLSIDDSDHAADIGQLMESYSLEHLTGSETPEKCVAGIQACTYLIQPFLNFYLCLTPDWLDTGAERTVGYPEEMRLAAGRSMTGGRQFANAEDGALFQTKQLLPDLHNDWEEPCVFYFSPVHFIEQTLGYAVLQRSLAHPYPVTLVYRNWLRFVNSALEMSRAKRRLLTLSVRDEMTGAYNRRGMYLKTEPMLKCAKPDDSLFVCVIDLDGLKYINDTFGHNEGDFGIRTVSAAVEAAAKENEICVRAGGDEFYIIGVGQYDADVPEQRAAEFTKLLEARAGTYEKPYTVTASIGCAVGKLNAGFSLDDIICKADAVMYQFKAARKRQRKI